MITVKLFAMLREAAGTDRLEVPLPAEPRVRALVEELIRRHPALGAPFAERRVLLAVNRSYASLEAQLADGDEVAFFPPVSGG